MNRGVTEATVEAALDIFRQKVREYERDFNSDEMTGAKWQAKYGTNLHSTGLGERWAMSQALTAALAAGAADEFCRHGALRAACPHCRTVAYFAAAPHQSGESGK